MAFQWLILQWIVDYFFVTRNLRDFSNADHAFFLVCRYFSISVKHLLSLAIDTLWHIQLSRCSLRLNFIAITWNLSRAGIYVFSADFPPVFFVFSMTWTLANICTNLVDRLQRISIRKCKWRRQAVAYEFQ